MADADAEQHGAAGENWPAPPDSCPAHARYSRAASPDGSWIAAVGSTTTDVAATDTGVAVARVKGHAVAFSGDGNVLVLNDRVVEWRTDHTLWLVPAGLSVAFVIGETGGSAVALDLTANQGAPSPTLRSGASRVSP